MKDCSDSGGNRGGSGNLGGGDPHLLDGTVEGLDGAGGAGGERGGTYARTPETWGRK